MTSLVRSLHCVSPIVQDQPIAGQRDLLRVEGCVLHGNADFPGTMKKQRRNTNASALMAIRKSGDAYGRFLEWFRRVHS